MKRISATGWIGLIGVIGLLQNAQAMDTVLHGFVDGRLGMRTRNDPVQDDRSLSELRLQFYSLTYLDRVTIQARADFVYDELNDDIEKVDLETGDGFVDLRELNILFTPIDIMDVKAGRQILTWGTGDLLFINDLFPKDWDSFLLGRDEEYLKAPSDAVFVSFFPAAGNFDVAYSPRMDADRYVDGRRISYWNPATQRIAGQNAIVDADRQDKYVQDKEVAVRFYRPLLSYEIALYAYRGFWKSPAGVDIETGNAFFPDMNAYGASIRGTLGSALVNAEAGYYDSLEEQGGADPFIPNSEVRFLTGYERELAKNLTAGMQYYLEWMMDYAEYKSSLLTPNDTARDEFRHVLTLRLTKMLMNQNLTLGLFTFYSPSDKDAYLRPSAAYRISDHWTASLSGNIFLGEDDHTFFGQFRHNNNFSLGLRYSF